MTSTSVAGVATFAMFSLVAAFSLSGPSSPSARVEQQVGRLAIAERLAPALRPDPVPEKIVVAAPSQFAREQRMSFADLMKRWEPLIKRASRRFKVPADWIREVIKLESGGRTMLAENMPMVSSRGARGLMQLLPATYSEMRRQYGLGADPFDPHDNIFAGAAYLSWLRGKYGYPAMLAAYNDGPGNYEQRSAKGTQFPDETRNYVTAATLVLGGGAPANNNAVLTQVNTTPAGAATSIPAVMTVAQPPSAATAPVITATATPPAVATTSTGAAPAVGNATPAGMASIIPPMHAPGPAAGLRPVSLATSCSFTETDGSALNVSDCGDVTSVRAPLAGESLPGAQAILSVGVTLHTVRENVAMVRKIVRSHGGRV
jgi:hypothetical protein